MKKLLILLIIVGLVVEYTWWYNDVFKKDVVKLSTTEEPDVVITDDGMVRMKIDLPKKSNDQTTFVPERDMIAEAFDFPLTELLGCSVGDTVSIEDPQGGFYLYEVVSRPEPTDGYERIQLKRESYISTITIRNHKFMALLMTPNGSYGISGDADNSIITNQFTYREAPHAEDATVPTID